MTPTQQFVKELAQLDSRIAELLAEHIADNDEVLPHVFMGDVARFAGDLARRAPLDDHTLSALLGAIEDALSSGDTDVEELVVVSFLENLHQTGSAYDSIVGKLGPASKAALARIERER